MPDIRVDPPFLRQASAKLDEAAERTGALGEEAAEAAAGAPSYDGQFGSQVQSLGAEAYSQMTAVATRLSALSQALLLKTEEFEAADSETQAGLQGLLAQLRGWINSLNRPEAPAWLLPSPLFAWLFQEGDPPPEEPEPWYGGLVLELSKAWDWYHKNVNQPIYDSVDTWQRIGENGRKITLYYLAQLWFEYDKAVNLPVYDSAETWNGIANNARTIVLYGLARAWFGYDTAVNQPIYRAVEALPDKAENLMVVQWPGSPGSGPLADRLAEMSATDASGNWISPVGADVARLIGKKTVVVTYLDINAGVVPLGFAPLGIQLGGYVLLPESHAGVPASSLGPGNMGFYAHELTHVLERNLNDPQYWPTGGLSIGGVRPIGDSTNYMEVLSQVVGLTVEYDLLSSTSPGAARLDKIQDALATFIGQDADNAVRYLVSTNQGVEVYLDNYVHEQGISDHRIPSGGWDHWLKEMGFTDSAIQHINDVASQGTAQHIDPATIDPYTALVITPSPTTTPSTTPIPSPTSTPMPSPTSTPTPTPFPTGTTSSTSSPVPTQGPSSTPLAPTRGPR